MDKTSETKIENDIIDPIYGDYAIYLRKSRSDYEAEEKGEEETLARHKKILIELSKSKNMKIGKIYKEVVSGENIADRPEMQKLLDDVQEGRWKGVLVVEVERLARGNTKDQGIVSEAFQFSGTKIITPIKIYDPDNEYDQEYFEFGLFMSRREYKIINRRLQRGRIESLKEGKYVGNVSPFGYDRKKLEKQKGFTIIPNHEAIAVKTAFELYAYQNISIADLVRRLDEMGFKSRKIGEWTRSSIKDLLRNPVYIGKNKWDSRKTVKVYKNGKVIKTRPRNENPILYDGIHEPLIDLETWNIVQNKLKNHKPPVQHNNIIQNPLAGIVVCGKCGATMQRRPYNKKGVPANLICTNMKCDNISSKLFIVENKIIKAMKEWLKEYQFDFSDYRKKITNKKIILSEESIKELKKELEIKNKKLSSIYDYFEEGIYSKEMFIERSNILRKELEQIKKSIEQQQEEIEQQMKRRTETSYTINQIKNVIDIYDDLKNAEEKNALLKTVLKEVKYVKTEKAIKKDSDPERFELDIYPILSNDI